MILFLIVGIAGALPGLFFVMLAIRSRNPQNLISTTGELTKKKGYKNYIVGKSTIVPVATEYIYTYVVDGKTYRLGGVQHTHARNVFKRISVVYLCGFPCRAYEEHFSGAAEWNLGIGLLVAGTLSIVAFLLLA